MAYFDLRRDAGLGCGADCACTACRRAADLGETYEIDEDGEEPGTAGYAQSAPPPAAETAARAAEALRSGGPPAALRLLTRLGVRDESRLTDLLFFARHPERQGRRIGRGEDAAAREWRSLRDRWVRPLLRGGPPPARPPAATPAPAPAPPVRPPGATGACPVEDPLPQLRHPTGTPSGAGGRKCWPATGKSLDIVDSDLPCTAQRSASAYRAVLRYFNVADSANLRYARTPTSTFCNIFAHDATRALRASIPHWVRDDRQRSSRPIGWNEINANSTFDWLVRAGPAAGWMPIDPPLIEAIRRIASARGAGGAVGAAAGRMLDAALARLPGTLVDAATRIARAVHADPGLLAQDSYLAQQFANLGFPTVVSWKNPSGRAGHIAMVAPESPGSFGARHRSGMYLPRTTQAGARNFEDGLDAWIVGARARRFFVHA